MAVRHTLPGIPGQTKKRKKAVVSSRFDVTLTTFQDVTADDPTMPTHEGNVQLFLDQALRRFNMAVDDEMYNRLEGLKDVLMVDGEGQWDDEIRGRRMRKKRPCLTVNRFIPMIAHIVNEQRMSRPAIQVDPVGGGADPDSASIRQGIIRHIEVTSGAETVYDNAFERMVEKGWSWFRIATDWESPLSHQQVIKIEGFSNDFCVYGDPTAEEPTRKDMKWVFVVRDIPRGEYVAAYPKSRMAGLRNFTSIGDDGIGWVTEETIRVAEYYYIEDEPVKSVRLISGDGVWEDEIEERAGLWWSRAELEAYDEDRMAAEELTEVPVDRAADGSLITRKSFRPKVKWALINAVEILDGDMGDDLDANTAGREIPGRHIPLIMVSGRERVIHGKRRLSGMVRNNRDAQRMYNYAISAFVEMIALAPKSPFIAVFGQIEKFKKIWDTANEENWPYLPYENVSANGQNVPPPQRQEFNPQVGALIQAIREFDNDLKIGFNIFDESSGRGRTADQSGRAITALQARSDSANMNWLDNMRRAQIYAGEIILDMIPVVYDAARIITIIRPNNKREEVQVNQEFATKAGKLVNYDMARGKYSVTVSLGEYASKRQEAVQSLSQIAQNVPEVALPLLPLILANMDTPMAAEAAAIVKRLLPTKAQEPGSPEQMAAQFREFQEQHEMLVDALERANKIIETKEIDNETKKEIATITARAQIAIAAAKMGSSEGIARLNAEYKRIGEEANRIHDAVVGSLDREHEKEMQAAEPVGATK